MQNTHSLPSFIKIAALALLAAGQPCFAISMLHTTNWNATDNTNPYIVEGAKYNSVGFVQWTSTAAGNASYVGTGTLVPSSVAGQFKFLTAAHNVDSEGPGNKADGVIDALAFTIYFGANTSANGSTSTGALTVPAANIDWTGAEHIAKRQSSGWGERAWCAECEIGRASCRERV